MRAGRLNPQNPTCLHVPVSYEAYCQKYPQQLRKKYQKNKDFSGEFVENVKTYFNQRTIKQNIHIV